METYGHYTDPARANSHRIILNPETQRLQYVPIEQKRSGGNITKKPILSESDVRYPIINKDKYHGQVAPEAYANGGPVENAYDAAIGFMGPITDVPPSYDALLTNY
jgi:hypothetical protein